MSPKTNVFLLGATGYIGGSVTDRLLAYPNIAITALVRSEEKASKLQSLGVVPILGSHADLDKIEKAASEADVVFSCADADNLDVVKAILNGLKKRHGLTGKVPLFIHTSGTGVLIDNAAGMYATDVVYSDLDLKQIESLPETQVHRNVDLTIVDADKQGYVKTYIILPSTIYGQASGQLVDLGVQNKNSIQIPLLIKTSLDRGQGAMVGEGKNLWPNVHIDDLAELYIIVFKTAVTHPDAGHGREGYYFAENGEHSLYEVGKRIAETLVELGKGKSVDPTTYSDEEVAKYFGGPWLGTNSRCRAEHSRAIGWKPVKTKEDMLASIKPEVEALLQK